MCKFKRDVLEMLALKKNKWMELKKNEEGQDAAHENFITDVILTLNWVMNDIEKMEG